MTRERPMLLHSKRPTWASGNQALETRLRHLEPRPLRGGVGQVLFREPLGRGAVGGRRSGALFFYRWVIAPAGIECSLSKGELICDQ